MRDKPLKIGILLRNRHDGAGGLEKVLQQMEPALLQKSVSLYFYSLYPLSYQSFTKNFKQIKYLPLPNFLNKKSSFIPKGINRVLQKIYITLFGYRLFEEMANDEIEALIILDLSKQFLKNASLLRRFKERYHIPLLSWVHSSLSNTSPKLQSKIATHIDLFDHHLAISEGIANEIAQLYGQQNSSIIYNPIEPAEIIERQSNQFLFIGRIDSNKRVYSLLKHLKRLKGDWQLDIYGSTGTDEKDSQLHHYIETVQLSENVTFHGWVDDPWGRIKKAGILLLNSEQEGFPLVIAEAMMRGIPVLSSDCPTGPSELITHGENGWLYPPNEESQITAILQTILNGELALPDQKVIQESVQHLDIRNTAGLFKSSFLFQGKDI